MPFKIVRNDLTRMNVDVIVNTANQNPTYSSGTDTAVYQAAGEMELLEARRKIGYLEEGETAITPGFRLAAKYIIHAVSPLYVDGNSGEEEKLRSCYRDSLKLAQEYHCQSIAFPLIATGSFGYPKEEGMRIALDEIHAFLMNHEMMIYLVVFDERATKLGNHLYPELESYIDRHYVSAKWEEEYADGFTANLPVARAASPRMQSAPVRCTEAFSQSFGSGDSYADSCAAPECGSLEEDFPEEDTIAEEFDFWEKKASALSERMEHLSDTFQEYFLYLLKEKNLTNAEVYKRALVTKQLFSKIKLNPAYHPDKATAMRLCVGAGLSLDETKDLLARAGYALSPCDKRDIIFSFFIEHQVYDMIEIDIALEEHGLPCFIE